MEPNLPLLTLAESWHALRLLWICWGACFGVSADCGLGNLIGGDKKQSSIATQISDSYNSTSSRVDSISDSGNVTLSLGGPTDAKVNIALPLVFGGLALLAFLWFQLRKGGN